MRRSQTDMKIRYKESVAFEIQCYKVEELISFVVIRSREVLVCWPI